MSEADPVNDTRPVRDYVMPDEVRVEVWAFESLVRAGQKRADAAEEVDGHRAKELECKACDLELSAERMLESLGREPGWWKKCRVINEQ